MKGIKNPFISLVQFALIMLIPLFFINMNIIIAGVDSVLHLKPNPGFSGGSVMARFINRVGNDTGSGTLTYPGSPAFTSGTLDLIAYTVYEPVINAPWNPDGGKDYWQLGFTFEEMTNTTGSVFDFSQPAIHVYINIDERKQGSTDTALPRCEMVTFDTNHPWDFMIMVDGHHKKGKLVSFDGTIRKDIAVYCLPEKKTVYARIPLDNPLTKKVLEGMPTYHYVLIGAYDELAIGNFMSVKKETGIHNGGGAFSELTPRVYGIVLPQGMDRKAVLSSFDDKSYKYAVVYPVEVKPGNNKLEPPQDMERDISILKQGIDGEARIEKEEALKQIKGAAPDIKPADLAALYFRAGEFDKSDNLFNAVLSNEASNSIALGYEGALTAMKGGKAKSILKAMEYVKEAFRMLDLSVQTAKNDTELVPALICRGSVSLSVPEMVFRKSEEGALDFIRAAKIWEKMGAKPRDTADLYIKASIAYENAGMEDEAEIYFTRAKNYTGLSAFARLELLKRGYTR